MDILFVIPSFRRGGVERITLNIINSLDLQQYHVHLLICSAKDNMMISYLKSGVNIVELPVGSVRAGLLSIFKYIRKNNIDLVFTSFNHLSLPVLFYKTCFRFSLKTVVRLNTLPSNHLVSSRRGHLYEFFFRYFIRQSNRIIAQSEEMKYDAIKHYGLKESMVNVIQNPVAIQQIRVLAKEKLEVEMDSAYFNLVAIGSLSEVKGFDLLIQAIGMLKAEKDDRFRLYIVGDNRDPFLDYHAVLAALIDSLDLSDRVFLLGFKSNPYPILNAANAFVLSSRKEGFPNVVLEALVLHKPCLVTDCVDLTDFINAENGLIIQRDSVEQLEKGIKQIYHYREKNISLSNFDFNQWFKTI